MIQIDYIIVFKKKEIRECINSRLEILIIIKIFESSKFIKKNILAKKSYQLTN